MAVVHHLSERTQSSCARAVRTCQRSGALAVIIVNPSERPQHAAAADPLSSGPESWDAEGVRIPAISVRRTDGELLWARLDDRQEVLLEDVAYTAEASHLVDEPSPTEQDFAARVGISPIGSAGRRSSFGSRTVELRGRGRGRGRGRSPLKATTSLPDGRGHSFRGDDYDSFDDNRRARQSESRRVRRRAASANSTGSASSLRLRPSPSSPLDSSDGELEEEPHSPRSPRQRRRRRLLRSPVEPRGGLATPVQTYSPSFSINNTRA